MVCISDKKGKNIKMNLDTNYEDEKLNKIVRMLLKMIKFNLPLI